MKTGFITCANPFGTHRMAYTEWGEPSAAPSVLCVHGVTRNGRDFDRLAEALEKRGRHVLCPDMAGRGKSDYLTEHPELYNFPQYISDLMVLLRLKRIKEPDWVGTSMGGLIGMIWATTPELMIRRLVINDVGPFIPLRAIKRMETYIAESIEFADKAELEKHIRKIYEPFGITRDEDWKHMVEHSYRALPNGRLVLARDPAIAQNHGAKKQDVDLWPVYDEIKCPTLVLHGKKSDVLSLVMAKEMTKRGPKPRLITYPGVGHAPALMDKKQIADVCEFLN